jgi:hypothetical protein
MAGLSPGTMVAATELVLPGVLAQADFDEDAAFCWVRLAWPRGGRATLVAFDGAGKEVGRKDLGAGTDSHQVVMLAGQGPIRRLELRAVAGQHMYTHVLERAASGYAGGLVEVDWVAYLALRDALDVLVAGEACDSGAPGGPAGYEGRGKLAFLPNHEYEVKLTTRVAVTHPSTPTTSANVDEFVYFRTKGLPGLNAVDRVGEEIDPYVRRAYAGGRPGVVYREEPVTLAFAEDFHVAVPLPVRPPGTSDEHTTLLRMGLLVTPDLDGRGYGVHGDRSGLGRRQPRDGAHARTRPVEVGRDRVDDAFERDAERRSAQAAARHHDAAAGGLLQLGRPSPSCRHGVGRRPTGNAGPARVSTRLERALGSGLEVPSGRPGGRRRLRRP